MDEKVRATGTVVSHVILIVLGVMLFPVSVGMLMSFPHWLFWLGMLLFVSCCTFFYSAFMGLRRGARQVQQLTHVQQQLRNIPVAAISDSQRTVTSTVPLPEEPMQHEQFEPGQLLVKWVISGQEWSAFYAGERKKRLESLWIESLLLVILGTGLLLLVRKAPWLLALGISTGIAMIWWIAKYFLHLKVLQSNRSQNQIIITTSSVQINGRLHVFYDEHVTPGSFQLLTNSRPMVVEIRYHWQTRRGATYEELRVPVPSGKETEAQEVVNRLSSFLQEPVVADGVKTGK